ncbi:hypothetical protein MHU86_24691 [Fragilaria crotonensis]|nr:hypothetical protein MHU86_24691 [Fragilaria crotonensis]
MTHLDVSAAEQVTFIDQLFEACFQRDLLLETYKILQTASDLEQAIIILPYKLLASIGGKVYGSFNMTFRILRDSIDGKLSRDDMVESVDVISKRRRDQPRFDND